MLLISSTLWRQISLAASPGSFSLNGSAASFDAALAPAAGSYSVSGSTDLFAVGDPVSSASYTLTGSVAGLAVTMTASPASYTLSGDAALTPSNITLQADPANFEITGADAGGSSTRAMVEGAPIGGSGSGGGYARDYYQPRVEPKRARGIIFRVDTGEIEIAGSADFAVINFAVVDQDLFEIMKVQDLDDLEFAIERKAA